MRLPFRFALLLVMWACLGVLSPVRAHDTSLSGIRILFRHDDAVVNVTTHISRLARAEQKAEATMTPAELDVAVKRRLHIRFDGKALTVSKSHVIPDAGNDLLSWQTVVPGAKQDCDVTAGLYPEDANSQTVVTVMREGLVVREDLLGGITPNVVASGAAPAKPMTVALRCVREGITHIFGGPDHIAFVLGLLLLGGTRKALLRTITAFTLAHSLTLTVAATGVWAPSPRIVEPLIALSIIMIACENLIRLRIGKKNERAGEVEQRDYRSLYAFGFGLVHGFGFAGALAEVGLPRTALGVALASFNIGVEVGQVGILLGIVPVLGWLSKRSRSAYRQVVAIGSVAIGMAGTYWFFARLGFL